MPRERNRDIDEIKKAEETVRRKKRKRTLIIAVAILFLLIMALVWFLIQGRREYGSYEVVSSSENAEGGDFYESFADGVVRYSANGIKFETTEGARIWDSGLSMHTPGVVFSEKYGLVYDIGGSGAMLFNEDGVVTSFSTMLPIAAAGISDYGVTAFMTQDNNVSSVYFYDASGRKLDIEVRNVLAKSSGYPISMSMSGSGKGLVLSLVFIDRGAVKTRISFLNFDLGKDNTDRVVGYFEYDECIFPEVDYLSPDRVVAFGDDRAVFYSLSNEALPKVIKEIEYDEEIESVFTKQGRAAVITRAGDGGHVLHIYDSDGEPVLEEDFENSYQKAEFSGNYALVYGSDYCFIATDGGVIKYRGLLDGYTTYMTSAGSDRFLQYGDYGIRTIRLK